MHGLKRIDEYIEKQLLKLRGIPPYKRQARRNGKLLRLRCGTNWIDGADDGPVAITAADDERYSGCCQSEPERGPEGLGSIPENLRQRPNAARVWP